MKTFKDIFQESMNPDYKNLENELNRIFYKNAKFGVLNDDNGVFTLTYKTNKNGKNDAKILAKQGFEILKKYFPRAKEVKASFELFPYEKDIYNYNVEYKIR